MPFLVAHSLSVNTFFIGAKAASAPENAHTSHQKEVAEECLNSSQVIVRNIHTQTVYPVTLPHFIWCPISFTLPIVSTYSTLRRVQLLQVCKASWYNLAYNRTYGELCTIVQHYRGILLICYVHPKLQSVLYCDVTISKK